ncbi:TonB-dependent receptor [Paraglaciecola aquimarina]|uniref:TonB-dependent receptor n=1 Tax=Paraglaciecola aquimarina TaxID=1235557 RepID=A0ABU3STY8_9ALTE|nr:TonB-dependent receptor [Paraglaciecola aquimarina]MDU0353462.1 TonB-dependent receptor [Paraglaciecola aquimarina]
MKFNVQQRLIAVPLILFTGQTVAESINLHGFVSQGVIQAADSNFVENDGDVSVKLTEIGVNASFRVNSSLRIAGQGVYLNGGNRYPEGARIDYLFLDWQLVNTLDWNIKAQIGRNKNYHWLYSSTRDVPHTRPSIVLPQSLYFDAFRDVALGVDGIALLAQTNNSLGEWDVNISYGESKISDQETRNLLGANIKGKLKHESDKQFSIYWRPSLTNWQLGVGVLDADFRYRAANQDVFIRGDIASQRVLMNLLYQGESWEFASEIIKERVVVQDLLYSGFASDVTAEGGYIQARYFPSPEVTLLARLDIYDKNNKDRDGSAFEASTGGTIPGYFAYMDQATLGLSWQLFNNVQIQTELHRVKGAGRLAPFFNPNVEENASEYWNIWAIQLMYWY